MENTWSNNSFLRKTIVLVLVLKLITSQVFYKESQYTNHNKPKNKEDNNTFDIIEILKYFLDMNLNNLTTNDNERKSKKKKKHSKNIEKQSNNPHNDNKIDLKYYKKNKDKKDNKFKKELKEKNKFTNDNMQINKNCEKNLKDNIEITSYTTTIKDRKFNNLMLEEAMVGNINSGNLKKDAFSSKSQEKIIDQENPIGTYHQAHGNKKEIKNKNILIEDPSRLHDEKALIKRKSLKSKFPVFIETKSIKYPVKFEANVKDNIIEIENLRHKLIKFDTKLSRSIENKKKPKILLFYSGIIRTVVNYICFDNKKEDIVSGKYKVIILYNNVNGFTEIDLNKFKEKNKTNLNDIKINLKGSSFDTDFLLQNQQELEDIPDYIYDKFVIMGETTFKFDVLYETCLNILL